MSLEKLINIFDKEPPEKPTVTPPLLVSVSSMIRSIVPKQELKQQCGCSSKKINQRYYK